ncbi:hypothetical protein DPMN_169963 [Dreissena polymorpha]|uniref:Uncharacterized protein n=1 Tax=Dreissena polymorpha TaxID=45954 RepID=A0A9D4DXH5_DREPO|nr:hypothetical protein DPMN_169963 [Dreissena polymorpha]
MVSKRKDLVTRKQRIISRIVTPNIQNSLFVTYYMCASESGPGSFEQCKTHMSKGIERERHSMFNKATENIMQELLALQQEVIAHVKDVCDVLLQDIRAAYEPLYAHSIQIRAAFLNCISKIAKRLEEIGFESHDYPNADEGLALHGNNPDNSADMILE